MIEDIILDLRRQGYSCSQAALVGLSRAGDFDMPPENVLKNCVAGLRGGIGKTFDEGTCGAVTGSVVALGFICKDDEAKTAELSKELFNHFKSRFGTAQCGRITDANGKKLCNDCIICAARKTLELVSE